MITITETRDHVLIAQLNEEVQNLHAGMHPEIFKAYTRSEAVIAFKDLLSDPTCRCYLASQNNENIGYAIFYIREIRENVFHHNIKSLYIDQVTVLSKYQGSGAGKLLLEQAEKLAKELSIIRLELDHWSANTHAARFFRNNGYSLKKERLVKIING